MVSELAPDACIHLAGIAFVPLGWTDPELVFSVNLLGTINVLEAFRLGAPKARLLIVTSAEIYGRVPGSHAFAEDAPLTPDNLYAVSKMAADLSSLLYARRYGMHVMTARPGNHIGPGQSPRFVTSAFAEQIVKIARKQTEPVLKVGNLECERDFTDVRDVARAYRLIAEGGRAGEAYNISSEKLRENFRDSGRTLPACRRKSGDHRRSRPLPPPGCAPSNRFLQGSEGTGLGTADRTFNDAEGRVDGYRAGESDRMS